MSTEIIVGPTGPEGLSYYAHYSTSPYLVNHTIRNVEVRLL